MYREVGDVFKFYDRFAKKDIPIILEVVETDRKHCKGCYFEKNCVIYVNHKDFTGFCASHNRDDKKDVIFKRIK